MLFVYGDNKYSLGFANKKSQKKLMLHAYELKFIFKNQKYTFRAKLPEYFKNLLYSKRLKSLNE